MKELVDEYVSFEVAKLLKEKGFEGKSEYMYDVDGQFRIINAYHSKFGNESMVEGECIAPTQALVMRWLREVRCILFSFHLCLGEKAANEGLYQIGVYEKTAIDTYTWRNWILGDTYEETYDKAIRYSLENLFNFDDDDDEDE